MSITVLVQVVETHVNEEEFQINSLPKDWEDLTELEQWRYVGEHGKYIDSNTIFTDVESVQEVNVEEESA